MHLFQDYIENSKIVAATKVAEASSAVDLINASVKTILEIERPILKLAGEVSADGTADLMTQFIAQQEKKYGCFLIG